MKTAVAKKTETNLVNLSDLGLPAFNALESVERPALPRIKVSRETAQFLIEEEATKGLEGHILSVLNVRAWWEHEYGNGTSGAPQCYAVGQSVPDPQCEAPQAETCLSCPHNKFSKAYDEDARGCHSKKRFLLLFDDEAIPYLLDVPSLGIRACDRWLTQCAAKQEVGPVLPLWRVRISLQKRQSRTSDFSGVEPVFELLQREDDRAEEIVAAVRAFGQQAREEAAQADVGLSDTEV